MISVDIITGWQDMPRLSRRPVCLAGSLGSNSTDRAALIDRGQPATLTFASAL